MVARRWFAITTWNAERQKKLFMLNTINGHLIGVSIRLPDGEVSGRPSHHALSLGRYCKH